MAAAQMPPQQPPGRCPGLTVGGRRCSPPELLAKMLELVGNLRIHGFASHWMKRRVSPRPQKHGHQGYAKYHADHGANPHPERDAALRRIRQDAVAITGHELVQ